MRVGGIFNYFIALCFTHYVRSLVFYLVELLLVFYIFNDGYHSFFFVWGDSLRAGRSGDRIPVGARFSAPVQTGTGTHPASYTCTTNTGSFSGENQLGRGVDNPPTSRGEVE